MTIRQVRELRRISQTALAERAGLARTHLVRIEGQAAAPRITIATLERLAAALDVPPSLLLLDLRK